MWQRGAHQVAIWVLYDEKTKLATIYPTCDHFRDMTLTNIGIILGFHWQITRVEFGNDVVHSHNTKWSKKFPLRTSHWEVDNHGFRSLYQTPSST